MDWNKPQENLIDQNKCLFQTSKFLLTNAYYNIYFLNEYDKQIILILHMDDFLLTMCDHTNNI